MAEPRPRFTARGVRLARRGDDGECEDALAFDLERGKLAVADGAAESASAGLWARLLVEEFVRSGDDWPRWIHRAQAGWEDAIRRPAGAEPLPWYLEGRFAQGAFATFLGLTLDGGSWRAQAVGDSCLFVVRGGQLLRAFPLDHSSQFGSTPWLIGSRTSPEQIPLRHGRHAEGKRQAGDTFWLMTDALSCWFLVEAEAGRQPWQPLRELLGQPEGAFADWVGQLRDGRVLRNDDTTLLGVW